MPGPSDLHCCQKMDFDKTSCASSQNLIIIIIIIIMTVLHFTNKTSLKQAHTAQHTHTHSTTQHRWTRHRNSVSPGDFDGFHTWEGTLVCPEECRFLAVQDFRCTVETSNWGEVELSSWSVTATTAGINSTVAESSMFVVKIGLVVTNCQSHTTHCEARNKERQGPMLTLKSNHILKANTTNIKKASSANGHPSLMAALVSAADIPSSRSPSSNINSLETERHLICGILWNKKDFNVCR